MAAADWLEINYETLPDSVYGIIRHTGRDYHRRSHRRSRRQGPAAAPTLPTPLYRCRRPGTALPLYSRS